MFVQFFSLTYCTVLCEPKQIILAHMFVLQQTKVQLVLLALFVLVTKLVASGWKTKLRDSGGGCINLSLSRLSLSLLL
jgi:hypothetical protein